MGQEQIQDWFKENWLKIAVILLLLSGFYWYGWRPTQIKQRCSVDAHFDAVGLLNLKVFGGKDRQESINDYYNDCLMRFGLK